MPNAPGQPPSAGYPQMPNAAGQPMSMGYPQITISHDESQPNYAPQATRDQPSQPNYAPQGTRDQPSQPNYAPNLGGPSAPHSRVDPNTTLKTRKTDDDLDKPPRNMLPIYALIGVVVIAAIIVGLVLATQ